MQLTILQAVKLQNAITEFLKSPTLDKKLIYALHKNKAKLQATWDAVAAMEKPSEAFIAFEKARQELVKQNTDKDGKITNIIQVEKDFEVLKLAHKEAIDEREKSALSIQVFLKTEEDFNIYSVSFDSLPNEINPAIYDGLEPMITPPVENAQEA